MKVCTDACVLGAWTPVQESHRILDIGTGTGLLPLMLAQRLTAPYHIHAVEIDPSSASQARTNVQESPFAETIHIYETAIQSFTSERPYDLIISNPPFFQNYLRCYKAQQKGNNPETAEQVHGSFAEAIHEHDGQHIE